ncbi:hypothetical protein AB4Y36_00075 [Paraburkholderia sp. BR10936]|uniref:hypothetical protein n=1 Tax=Paraburkholderia sp. BR10936 TaxID=3236993 RepID=UPI0034D2F4F5
MRECNPRTGPIRIHDGVKATGVGGRLVDSPQAPRRDDRASSYETGPGARGNGPLHAQV